MFCLLQVKVSDRTVVRATDTYKVSVISISGVSAGYIEQTGLFEPLPTDFRGNVTFTATNLFGLTSSCNVSITTFTTQRSWNGYDMDATDCGKAAAAAQNSTSPVYYVNTTYSVAGPKKQLNFTNSKLFENYYGNASEILFEVTVTPQVDGLVYIDQQSGDVNILPAQGHLVNETANETTTYTAELRGRDAKGAVAVVNRWSFAVELRPEFKVMKYTRSSGHDNGMAGLKAETNMVQRVQDPFAVGEAFRVAAVNLTGVVHADAALCTFTLKGNASSAGLFINPATGAIQGLIDKVGSYRMSLVAQDEHGADDVLEDVVLDVRETDVQVTQYGPNSQGCGDNGEAVDDPELRFDKQFTCKCDTGFLGGNCTIRDTNVATIVAGVLGSVIVILSAIVFVKWYQAYQARIAPVDFMAQFQAMVEAGLIPGGSTDRLSKERTPRELPRLWLTLLDRLGSGNFGEVSSGQQRH